ncbi:MAG: PDZ domain-containing protein [Planctomycetota bacterium]
MIALSMIRYSVAAVVIVLFSNGMVQPVRAQDSLEQLKQEAITRAVGFASESVVQIDAVGGLEVNADTPIGTGPFSGVIASADGLILTSGYNLRGNPAGVFARLPNGERVNLTIYATDHSRNLVILKAAPSTTEFTPATFAEKANVITGQTALAVGKVYDWQAPNISVGIVSATGRIWDRAVQTDAKVSSANYGGPLINLRGEVIGILTPLATDSETPAAGAQWYDSGIGFAACVDRLLSRIGTVEPGTRFKAGIAGLEFSGANIYSDPPEVAVCRVDSPAYVAGIRKGDTITAIDGIAIQRQAEFRHEIGDHYGGDRVTFTVHRGDESLDFEIELVSELPPYRIPAIGIVVSRNSGPGDEDSEATGTEPTNSGVTIRHVIPDSAAAMVELLAGDRMVSVSGTPVNGYQSLQDTIAGSAIGEDLQVTLIRNEAVLETTIRLQQQSAGILEDLPPIVNRSEWSVLEVKVADAGNSCFAIAPTETAEAPPALLVWLPPPGKIEQDSLVPPLIEFCSARNVILLVVSPADETRWDSGEADVILRAMQILSQQVSFETDKVVIGGLRAGGAMAAKTVAANRQSFRGLAIVQSNFPVQSREMKTSAVTPLLIYHAGDPESGFSAGVMELREQEFPLFTETLDSLDIPLVLERLIEWTDSVDRL